MREGIVNELSLFTGAGGGLLGTKLLGWNHIGYVEINDYCQRIIRQRIDDGLLDSAPIFGDIRTFLSEGYADSYQGMVDVITAGFPCQPFSQAGKRRGEDDARNMWPATIEVIRRVQPAYCLLENVPGLLSAKVDQGADGLVYYFGTILSDLAESGYDAKWCVLGADDVGGPHRRKRLWIVANAKRDINEQPCQREVGRMGRERQSLAWDEGWEAALTRFRKLDAGLAGRVEQTDAIRNGQVPAVVREAWDTLTMADQWGNLTKAAGLEDSE